MSNDLTPQPPAKLTINKPDPSQEE